MQDERKDRFRSIYEEHAGSVLSYALRRVGSPDEAKDVVSETFLVAWRRFDDLPDPPLPWLLGTARRVLANQRRAAGNREHLVQRLSVERLADGDVTVGGSEGGGSPAADERARRVREAMSLLPETYRESLALMYWEGLSTAEAARAMGCSRAAMLVRLHRARRMLERELTKEGDVAAAGAIAGIGGVR